MSNKVGVKTPGSARGDGTSAEDNEIKLLNNKEAENSSRKGN